MGKDFFEVLDEEKAKQREEREKLKEKLNYVGMVGKGKEIYLIRQGEDVEGVITELYNVGYFRNVNLCLDEITSSIYKKGYFDFDCEDPLCDNRVLVIGPIYEN